MILFPFTKFGSGISRNSTVVLIFNCIFLNVHVLCCHVQYMYYVDTYVFCVVMYMYYVDTYMFCVVMYMYYVDTYMFCVDMYMCCFDLYLH